MGQWWRNCCGVRLTNVQHCIDDDVYATLFCYGDCVHQLALGPPTGRNSAPMVKFSKVPLKSLERER